jgi:hypothetical protein
VSTHFQLTNIIISGKLVADAANKLVSVLVPKSISTGFQNQNIIHFVCRILNETGSYNDYHRTTKY